MINKRLAITLLFLFYCFSMALAVTSHPSQAPVEPKVEKINSFDLSDKERIKKKSAPKLTFLHKLALKIMKKRLAKSQKEKKAIRLSWPVLIGGLILLLAGGGLALAILSSSIFLSALGIIFAIIGFLALGLVIFLGILLATGSVNP